MRAVRPASRFVLLALLLVVGASPASAAKFTIIQAKGADYVPVSASVDCGKGKCKTSLDPDKVTEITGKAYTAAIKNLESDLTVIKKNSTSPDYTVAASGESLGLDFTVTKYMASQGLFKGLATGSGALVVDFTAQEGVKLPDDLHWVQVLMNNFNNTGVDGTKTGEPTGPGKPENVIDHPFAALTPFYDKSASSPFNPNPFNSTPPHFEDMSGRPEPTPDNPKITWTADLFLVSAAPGSRKLTVYDAVRWGWFTQFTANAAPAPEPSTWTLAILGMGLTGAALRRRARRPDGIGSVGIGS